MDLEKFKMAPFYDLDKSWALVTVGNKEKFNTMTISWGGFGTFWHRPVVTIYVRKSRYTHEFLENNEYFTVSFYGEDYKKDLGILGSKSGRDEDKISLTNLTTKYLDNAVTFEEAKLTIVLRKIFKQEMNLDNMPKEYVDKFYNDGDIHDMFIGEVVELIDKRDENE